jgi:hypothetical protein
MARDLGWETIQAHVTELPSSISLDPDVDQDKLLIKEEYAYFLKETQLDKTRPDSKKHLDVTVPAGYRRLLNHIELHRYLLEKERDQPLAADKAAALQLAATSWYDNVYLPIIEVIRQEDVLKHFPGCSETDLYIWLIKHQAALRDHHDLDKLDLPKAVHFWLAYANDSSPQPNLKEADLPRAVEEFLQSIEKTDSPYRDDNAG